MLIGLLAIAMTTGGLAAIFAILAGHAPWIALLFYSGYGTLCFLLMLLALALAPGIPRPGKPAARRDRYGGAGRPHSPAPPSAAIGTVLHRTAEGTDPTNPR